MPLDPKTLIYAAESSVREILQELEEVQSFDKTSEKKLRVWNCLACCGVFGGFIAVSFLFGLVSSAFESGGGVFVVMSLLALGAIALLIRVAVSMVRSHGRWVRGNLEDRRYQFMQGLLPLLAVDLSTQAPVRLDMDLSPINSEHKKTRPNGTKGSRGMVYVADDWLTLQGRFADGTAFTLKANDTAELGFHRKSFKNKTKTVTRLVLRLRPKTKRYGGLDVISKGAEAAVQLPTGCVLKKLKVTEGDVRLTTAIKVKTLGAALAPGTVCPTLTEAGAAMFLSAYQILNLSRYATRRGRQKGPS